MIDWLMIFVGGLLGSSHCVGMCGAFVLTLGVGSSGLAVNLRRQVSYALGRVFTYAIGGAAAGYAGWRLAQASPTLVNVQAILCVVAGVLLVVQGLVFAGVLRWPAGVTKARGCLGPGLFASLLRSTRARSAFLGGVVNGFLPCGLVYAYLTLAISLGSLWRGMAAMTVFGLGTIPALVLLGCGGTILSLTFRRHVLRVAAWCVVLTGVLSIGRGVGFFDSVPLLEAGFCPYCR
jgi:sulfite exporter TauE/SafE